MPTTLSRQYYLSKGKCPNCKGRDLANGRSKCSVCLDATNNWTKENGKHKETYNKSRYDELKALGLCVCCKRPSEGHVYCQTCMRKINGYRARYHSRHSRNRWSKRG